MALVGNYSERVDEPVESMEMLSGMETLPHEVKNHRPNFTRGVIRSCKSKYNTVAKRKIKNKQWPTQRYTES